MTDSIEEVRDMLVDCYHSRLLVDLETLRRRRMDADPPGAPATAVDPSKGAGE